MKIYNLETKHQYILIQLLITFFILNKLIVLSSQYMDKNMIKKKKRITRKKQQIITSWNREMFGIFA